MRDVMKKELKYPITMRITMMSKEADPIVLNPQALRIGIGKDGDQVIDGGHGPEDRVGGNARGQYQQTLQEVLNIFCKGKSLFMKLVLGSTKDNCLRSICGVLPAPLLPGSAAETAIHPCFQTTYPFQGRRFRF